ncbi:Nmad3 family putative nucleotide modification protein [Haloplasma contractile]|uniref:Nucleotide modification associated domain-containing protein n=1 Tax=Haloplasma contractile SSD-17B TaxID=1033810 RepID=F7Q2J3_9MOLU|nr:hypothetical protein [Haloplasma contractile]ERJ11971.1 hypothetical protein HLPCO_001885 [Haloplasma contractile SSD-17B]
MKIILSRKGFDSGSGGFPSPILPNGDLLSLPIPCKNDLFKYSKLKHRKYGSYYKIMKQLTSRKLKEGKQTYKLTQNTTCHLDPDLDLNVIERKEGWRPLFGQSGAALTHLRNQAVGKGDLFIQFGWFRKTIMKDRKLMFDPEDKTGRHIIFGYLQVGDIIDHTSTNVPDFVYDHPHYQDEERRKSLRNAIYMACESVSWNNLIPGAGVFKYDDSLVLTKVGYKKSHWELPSFFMDATISFHNENSFKDDHFKCVDRGQEFVIQDHKSVVKWARELIEKNIT